MTRFTLITTAMVIAIVSSAAAEDRFPTQRSEEFEWGIGLGALIEDEGYRDLDFDTSAIPVLYMGNKYFRFFANQLDFQLVNNERVMFGLKLEGRFDGFEAKDDPYFEGMEDRDGGFFAGVRAEYKTPYGNIVGEWQSDVSGNSDGSYGALGSYWSFRTGRGLWVPKVALEYYDSSYTDYYFGVRPDEVRADRPAYEADSAIHLDVGLDYIFDLADRHQLITSVKYRRYDSEVKDSPLVDASGSPRVNIGYLYTF
ncbi:MAG: MipA/OmpV family protein [Pseudomonadota bacterium]